MNVKTISLLASLLAVGLAGGVSAATVQKAAATSQRCDDLKAQFDSAKASHSSAKGYTKALAAREAGEASCKSGDYNKGVASLDAALHDIGVKPTGHKS